MGWYGPTGACGCCGGCRKVGFLAGAVLLDSTFTDSRLFADFVLQEGAEESGPFTQPTVLTSELPGSFSDRVDLGSTERMRPPDVLASDAEAWFHMIELDGDADLEWAGGTIELRGGAGTVTAGGETVPILADAYDETYRSRLVLYVSPTWYGVFVMRYHDTTTPSTGVNKWGTTRGSIQVIDRVNDVTDREVTLTGIAAKVYMWTVADASVRVTGGYEYGEVTDRCSVPQLPAATERSWLHHTAGTLTSNPYGTVLSYPDTFDLDPSPEVTDGTTTGTVGGKYAGTNLINTSFTWSDRTGATVFTLDGDLVGTLGDGFFGTLITGGLSVGVIQYIGDFYVVATPGLSIDFYHVVIWPLGTAGEPYRKPVLRHYLRLVRGGGVLGTTVFSDVIFGSDGTAAATLSAFLGFSATSLAVSGVSFTDVTIGWSGE